MGQDGQVGTRTGRPPKISRPDIIAAARRIIDADGVEKLTMRRLAQDLGSTPMAVYHHVRDKEELLLLVLDDIASGMLRPELPDDPRERIIVTAQAMHDTLARVPWVVQVITADDLFSPTALWYNETVIDAAMACGLTIENAVYAYRSIWYYTAGELIIRAAAARRRAEDGRPTFREQVFADLDAEELPRLSSLAGRWTEISARDTYTEGLRAFVDGLLAAYR
ncbi:TetR/AcrR family transcriptional regulator [Actinomadura rudentiformis]|uniref:TetR/AcrR family transcriptional regulator n=1 Tax=Actinomadura rudentiformis TaxID=359158 RepID=A0A6H9YUN0_9ACTN|nr:TetR/AcrR family transcriptional regulator [Actinomadura rudentiformis]